MSLKDFRRQLVDALRDRTLLTSVKRLKSKGQHNVRILRLADLGPLLEDTVERILEDKGLEVTENQKREIETETRDEVALLLQEHREVLADRDRLGRDRDRLRRKVAALRKELERQTQTLEEERARSFGELGLRLDSEGVERFQEHLGDAVRIALEQLRQKSGVVLGEDSVTQAIEALNRSVANVVQVEAQASDDRERQAHLERVEQLERRLEELRAALSDSEDAYDRIAGIA